VIVDPKSLNFPIYRGVTLFTPNRKEFAEATRSRASIFRRRPRCHAAITQVRPSALAKGSDYTREQVVGHEIPAVELDILQGFSTTLLVDRAPGATT
jgi:bifunctional ADP-heptose synthase (sugar kinase/adenylyltransferase)